MEVVADGRGLPGLPPVVDAATAAPGEAGASAEAGGGAEEHALRRARDGQAGGFATLVRLHQARVYSLALRLLGLREDAQELAQDVFLHLHRHLAGIESAVHLRAWLRRVVCHRAIERLRRRPRLAPMPLDAAAEVSAPGSDTDALLETGLLELITQLPPAARAVLLLRYQEDLDPPEIAHTLHMPLNTVKSHLRRSLQWLRRGCGGQSG